MSCSTDQWCGLLPGVYEHGGDMTVWMRTFVNLVLRQVPWQHWLADQSQLEVLNVTYAYAVFGRPVARKSRLLPCQQTWEEMESWGLVQLRPVGK